MTSSLFFLVVNVLWFALFVSFARWSYESRLQLQNVINERNKELHNTRLEVNSLIAQRDSEADLADKRQATILKRDATIRARDARIEELETERSNHLKGLAKMGELFAKLKDEYAEYRNESGNAIQALTLQLDALKDRHSRLLEFHERLRASAHKALIELRSELEN